MANYFFATHTLYFKAFVPIIIKLIEAGEKVVVKKTHPNFLTYSPEKYRKKPTSNTCVNLSALEYIADVIDVRAEFDQIKDKIDFSFFPSPTEKDIAFLCTKNIGMAKKLKSKCKEVIVLGYQHMPFMLRCNQMFKNNYKPDSCEKIFRENNDFSNLHDFVSILKHESVTDYKYLNFINLDIPYKYKFSDNEQRFVLIFHPGGYRNVITAPGESKENSYEKQKDFIFKMCKPIIEAGLIPVIKTHPLHADFHGPRDLEVIKNNLIKDCPEYEKLIVTDDNYWKYAAQSKYLLNIGSSSLYELYAAGYSNVVVCNFWGTARSVKFEMLKGLFIDSLEDYEKLFVDLPNNLLDQFSSRVYEAYSCLNTGDTVEQVLKEIRE